MDSTKITKFIREHVFHATQGEMAIIAGVHQSSWSAYEKDGGTAEPRLSNLKKIRDAAIERGLPWKDEWLFVLPDQNANEVVSE